MGLQIAADGMVGTLAFEAASGTDIVQKMASGQKFSLTNSADEEKFAVSEVGNLSFAGTADGRDLATDGGKLDLVEASADVTDETNVLAALANSAAAKDMGGGAITNVGLIDGIDVSTLDGAVVKEADFNDQTVLMAVLDDTPTAVTVTEQTLVGRKTGGDVGALSTADALLVLGVEANADVTDETNVLAALANSAAAKDMGGGNITNVGTVDGLDCSGVEAGADVTDATNVDAAGAVMEADFNAQTILAATLDDTPAAVTLAEQTLVGRKTGGNVAALSAADALSVLGLDAALQNLAATEIAELENIGAAEISAAEWGFVAGMQDVGTAAAPTFAGGTFTAAVTLPAASPTNDNHAARKKYVDDEIASAVQGIDWSESVKDKDLFDPPGSPATGDRYVTDFENTGNTITAVDQGTKKFVVAEDLAAALAASDIILVTDSTGNDGWYTVVSATWTGLQTDIIVSEALPDATADGKIWYIDTSSGWSDIGPSKIVEYNGATWDSYVPTEGTAVWIEDEDVLYVFNDEYKWVKFGSTVTHANLNGLQGGTASEYYHLTSAQHTEVTNFFGATDMTGAEAEELTDGSETSKHYHDVEDGAQIKSGKVSANEVTSKAVVFTTPFVNNTPVVSVQILDYSGGDPLYTGCVTAVSLTGFTYTFSGTTPAAQFQIGWVAVKNDVAE